MIPLRDLLNKIRWDKRFGSGSFTIGYYDRIEGEIIQVPFQDIILSEGDHFAFQLVDESGRLISVPFHRVRQVEKNGITIWARTESEIKTRQPK